MENSRGMIPMFRRFNVIAKAVLTVIVVSIVIFLLYGAAMLGWGVFSWVWHSHPIAWLASPVREVKVWQALLILFVYAVLNSDMS